MAEITTLISSSPIKSHPSTHIIDQTIKSIRERLPDSKIIIMCDGVRPEQEGYRLKYEEYVDKLLTDYIDCQIVTSDEFKHQARMTRDSLEYVNTPLVFYVEHDMVLCEDIPFEEMAKLIMDGKANSVRLMFEAHVLEVHEYLTRGREGNYTRTVQYSQRPHLASTDFYRTMLNKYFSDQSKTFIEDRMYGIVSESPWENWKLWLYTPEGDNKRCFTTDGREDDIKYDDRLVY